MGRKKNEKEEKKEKRRTIFRIGALL